MKIEIKGPLMKTIESKSDTLFVHEGRLYAKMEYRHATRKIEVCDMYGQCAEIPFGTLVSFIKSISVEVE